MIFPTPVKPAEYDSKTREYDFRDNFTYLHQLLIFEA